MKQLQDYVDTLITIHNEKLIHTVSKDTSMIEAFRLADDVLRKAVQGITDIITVPGLINVDFADVKTIISGKGLALMGTGEAGGEFRAVRAVKQVIDSPLLEGVSIGRAKELLINVTGGEDLTLHEVTEAMNKIHEIADPEANIIFGAVVDERLTNEIKITVIATNFQNRAGSDDAKNSLLGRPKPSDKRETDLLDHKRKKAM